MAAVIVKGNALESDGFCGAPDSDLDWSDFFFNLVSMVIVYVYFSKTAAAGESMVAILLCMGVAGLDILLMAMRWLWFDHYITYGWVTHWSRKGSAYSNRIGTGLVIAACKVGCSTKSVWVSLAMPFVLLMEGNCTLAALNRLGHAQMPCFVFSLVQTCIAAGCD